MQAIIGRLKQNAILYQLASGTQALRHSRPMWWPVTMLGFLVGATVVGMDFGKLFYLGLAYFSLPYNLLRFGAHDVFYCLSSQQTARQTDSSRAWLSRDMLPGTLLWIVAVQVAFLVPLLLLATPAARLWLLALVLVSLAYSAPFVRLKEAPLLDMLSFASWVAGPLVFAQLLVGSELSVGLFGAFLAWAAATYLFGSAQDIEIDRLGWIRSTARSTGMRLAILGSIVLYAGSAAGLWYTLEGDLRWLSAVVLLYIINALRFVGVSNPELLSVGWRILLKLNIAVCLALGVALVFSV
jgi:4-hydroxybenzoate polyprenyltransferase